MAKLVDLDGLTRYNTKLNEKIESTYATKLEVPDVSSFVDKTTEQTIAGVKTFTSIPILSFTGEELEEAPSNAMVNKEWVQQVLPDLEAVNERVDLLSDDVNSKAESSAVEDLASSIDEIVNTIPTQTSQLTNNSGFITVTSSSLDSTGWVFFSNGLKVQWGDGAVSSWPGGSFSSTPGFAISSDYNGNTYMMTGSVSATGVSWKKLSDRVGRWIAIGY